VVVVAATVVVAAVAAVVMAAVAIAAPASSAADPFFRRAGEAVRLRGVMTAVPPALRSGWGKAGMPAEPWPVLVYMPV